MGRFVITAVPVRRLAESQHIFSEFESLAL